MCINNPLISVILINTSRGLWRQKGKMQNLRYSEKVYRYDHIWIQKGGAHVKIKYFDIFWNLHPSFVVIL